MCANAICDLRQLTPQHGPDIVMRMRGRRAYMGGIMALGVIAAVARAEPGFDQKTAIATATLSQIDTRVADIDALRAQAAGSGQGVKLSCIEEKLKRAKANAAAAKTVMDGWSVGETSPAYAQRSLDRLMLLQVYSMVYAEEAKACTGAKAGQSLDIKGDKSADENGKDERAFPVRPPKFERPPLASPF
jgi:hypothetical protein